MPMTSTSRKERERERHRREVLDAAEAVFAQKGYHRATMQEIAERAEFAVGTIYTMFEGKPAIYHELIEMRARQYMEAVRERIAQLDDPRAQVRAIIAAKLRFFDENRRFFEIFTRATSDERSEQPVGLSQQGRAIYEQYMGMVAGVFADGVRKGLFVDVDPVLLVVATEGATNAIVGHSIHTGGRAVVKHTPEQIESLLFHGILARREPRP